MIKNFIKNKTNILIIITTLITGLIIHLPLYTKNILTADVLLNNFYYSSYSWEVSLGRFGLFIVGLLKQYLVIPHIEIFISLILVSFISILIINLFNIKNKLFQIIISIIITICPNISAILLFNYCSLPYILAFFCSILAVYILLKEKNKYIKNILPIILIIISESMYQSFIQVSITLLVLYYINELLKNKFNFTEFIRNMITIGIGLISYFIIMKLSVLLLHINLSDYSSANSFGLKNILNIPQNILTTYKTFYNFYFTNKIVNNTNVFNHIINISLLLILITSITYKTIKNKLYTKNIIILFLLILVIPICTNFILLIITDTSMQLLMSSAYILLIPFVISLCEENKYLKILLLIISLLLIKNYIIQDSATYKSLETTYNKTYKIASNIVDNINKLGYDKKVMITGNLSNNKYYNYNTNLDIDNIYNLNYGFIANKSLFWDEYVNVKNGWTRYLYEYLGVNINFIDENTYNEITKSKEFKDMENYPNKNSIKLINNTIVIKL